MSTTKETTPAFPNEQLGRSALRCEDFTLLTGTGRFADDLPIAKGTHAVAFLRSPHAHAEIEAIDAAKALTLPGVVGVVTGADASRLCTPFISGVKAPINYYCLAVDRVRFAGEPVCMVVARNRYIAEDALELVSVRYKPLDVVNDPVAAKADEAPRLHPDTPSNIVHDRSFKYGEPDQCFEQAEHRVKLEVEYPRNSATPIECFNVCARYKPLEDLYEVDANFQGPYTLHTVMAQALGVPGNRLRLRTPPDSGGSYGVKQAIFTYIVACCVAARETGQQVRWQEDRLEHLCAATAATNRIVNIEAATDGRGVVQALRLHQLEDCGAYLRAPEPATLYRMHGNLNGAYAIEHIALHNQVVVTNKTPTGLVRGFGGPQLYFAIERLMDEIAKTLDIDPIELRQRNFVTAAQMPYRTASGALLDSGDYADCVAAAVANNRYQRLIAKRDAVRAQGGFYGIGCAAVVEPSISNMGYIATLLQPEIRTKTGPKNGNLATATVAFDATGSISVTSSSVPQGQGHRTTLAQVVAEVFAIEVSDITVTTDHDTGKDPWSIASGNYSSRFAGAVAGATFKASTQLKARIVAMAAERLNAPPDDIELKHGQVFRRGSNDTGIALSRLAASAHWAPLSMPEAAGAGLRETAFWSAPQLTETDPSDRINSSAAYGFIFDLCGVEVDAATGEVRIDEYVTAHDAGQLLNPMLVDGQIRGGFAHGLGAALLEEFHYSHDGAFLSGTLADYLIPTACEVPTLDIVHRCSPSPFTPLGAKGVGEGNCMSTPVCIANAVADALTVSNVRLPLHRSTVAALIQEPESPPIGSDMQAATQPTQSGHGVNGEGATRVPAPIDTVWNMLLDPENLARVIPGCEQLDQVGPNNYEADMFIGVGPIRGKFTTRVTLSDLQQPTSLRLQGSASGALGESTGEGQLVLKEYGAETEVSYQYHIVVTGKAASIGGRMLDGATRSFVGLFFKQLVAQPGQSGLRTRIAEWWQRIRRAPSDRKQDSQDRSAGDK